MYILYQDAFSPKKFPFFFSVRGFRFNNLDLKWSEFPTVLIFIIVFSLEIQNKKVAKSKRKITFWLKAHFLLKIFWWCNFQQYHSPCSLAANMTSAEGSKKFHYNIPAPLHSTCWINTFEGSKWNGLGSYIFFIFLMYTGKSGLALPRFYKILAGPIHVYVHQ